MEAIPAANVIDTITLNKDERIERFNSMINHLMADHLKYSNMDKPFRLELPFAKFGNTLQDIQFVIDAGYGVYSNITDNTWIVRLFPVSTKASDEIIIPTAEEVRNSMSSIEDRRKVVFKKRVDEERNKTDPTDFLIRLRFNEFGKEDDDIRFVRNLGYTVTEGIRGDHCWNVTLPEQNYFNGDL